jgi:hypothetical protein
MLKKMIRLSVRRVGHSCTSLSHRNIQTLPPQTGATVGVRQRTADCSGLVTTFQILAFRTAEKLAQNTNLFKWNSQAQGIN